MSSSRVSTSQPARPPSRFSSVFSRSDQLPANGTKSALASRRSSFSFLRRGKSSEKSDQPRTDSGEAGFATTSKPFQQAQHNAASRTPTRDDFARQQEQQLRHQRELQLREQQQAAKSIPRLPSVQLLPRIKAPFADENLLAPPQSSNGTTGNHYVSQSSSWTTIPKRPGGYNPAAFYSRDQQAMEKQSIATMNTTFSAVPATSGISTPKPAGKAQSVDAFPKAASITNRSRYDYVAHPPTSTSNNAARARRRRDPTPFNVLIVGTKSCGKTAMIEFLRTSLARGSRSGRTTTGTTTSSTSTKPPGPRAETISPFTTHFIETEVDGERVGVTLYDSKGLERHLVDLQLREMSTFIETKFQETFYEEQKVQRAANAKDTHVHAVLLLLDPARLDANQATNEAAMNGKNSFANMSRLTGILDDDLDISVIRALQGKTTIVPVISKADTVSIAHMAHLKRAVWETFKTIKFDPLAALDLDGEDDADSYDANTRESSVYEEPLQNQHPAERGTANKLNGGRNDGRGLRVSANSDLPTLPLSVLSPDVYEPGIVGRRFPWGFADPYNPEHCDFSRLKDSIFSDWRVELREASRNRWYEGWRTNRLNRRGLAAPTQRDRSPTAKVVSNARAYGSPTSKSTNTGPHKAEYTPDSGVGEYRSIRDSEIGIAMTGPGNGDRSTDRQYDTDGDTF